MQVVGYMICLHYDTSELSECGIEIYGYLFLLSITGGVGLVIAVFE
jgi:hypothetical protein